MKGWPSLPEERCGTCKYFRLHYRRTEGGRYYPLRCGHCVHPRLKNRRVEEHCPHWAPRDTEAQDR